MVNILNLYCKLYFTLLYIPIKFGTFFSIIFELKTWYLYCKTNSIWLIMLVIDVKLKVQLLALTYIIDNKINNITFNK